MSLLPTTRINSLVSSTTNVGALESSLAGQDEDILLVDFQPVVVPNSQILSSPSTTTSTAMYPIPPPGSGGPLPGPHLVGMNHHPSISSDGMATPLSATGSSGKTHNPNNYSLVSLSNHVHHHSNNTSRDESDLNYHPGHLHALPPGSTTAAVANAVTNAGIPYVDDENDEFARHQALAQPSYMFNKRRSRRFANRDNHVWDNANHVGLHQQPQGHMSSSLSSSSEESDTGFLMGTRKTAYTRRSVQKVVDPNPGATVGGGGGNASPSATTGLLPNLGNRKRVRRRRPSARNRKPVNHQRDKMPNPSDVLSFCCCFCEDEHSNHRSSNTRSLRNRYFRLICFIVICIVITVLASITVSLQRKVDSLDWSLKRIDEAIGSPLASDSSSGASNHITKPSESLESLISAHNQLNATVAGFKLQLEQAITKLQELQKQVSAAASKQDGVAEVRGELAKLGSRVAELKQNLEQLKTEQVAAKNNENSGNQAADKTKETKPAPEAA